MARKKPTSKGGRPTKYKPEYNVQVEKLCLLGATDKDLADFFNVEESTINNWKKDFPEFLVSLKRGKQVADMEVAHRLYTRAVGYSYKEVTKERVKSKGTAGKEDEKETGKMQITKEVTKEIAPDPVSCFFWLKNRQKEKWRDKIDHGFDLPDEIIVRRPKDDSDEEADDS